MFCIWFRILCMHWLPDVRDPSISSYLMSVTHQHLHTLCLWPINIFIPYVCDPSTSSYLMSVTHQHLHTLCLWPINIFIPYVCDPSTSSYLMSVCLWPINIFIPYVCMSVTYQHRHTLCLDALFSGCPTSNTKTICIWMDLYGNWTVGLNSAVKNVPKCINITPSTLPP